MAIVTIGNRPVGSDAPCFIIAEIGINHNGDLGIAKKLITAATVAGCDAVKFQKRTPDLCVPPEQRALIRETPWGIMSYLDYKYHIEFGRDEYIEIDDWCRSHDILWFAS
jgi:N-acetylneuraminate synthase